MSLIKEIKYDFSDVLIRPKNGNCNSRSEIDLRTIIDKKIDKSYMKKWKPIPIVSSNMDTVTGIEMAFELVKQNWIAVLHKYVSKEDIKKLYDWVDEYNKNNLNKIDYRNIFISRGTSKEDKIKLKERIKFEKRIKSVCIDVANGHREEVFEYIKSLRKDICKNKILMVGNIGFYDAAITYAKIGVDIVKLGIGPGSVCTTRVKTGVGHPQISLILETKEQILDKNILICSDGGCKNSGDIAKAFAVGSDFVMIGGMLSGHKETPGEIDMINGKKVKRFSGMAAKESQQSGVPNHGVEEGKTVFITYKGKVINTIKDIEGGVRSSCTYTNSKNIDELISDTDLILTNVQENKIYN